MARWLAMTRTPFAVDVPGGALAADRWPGAGPTVVLLHAGVADRRGWTEVAGHLAATGLDVVAYDRRGFGATPPGDAPFTHLDDLRAVLDATAGDRPAWLVGNSMGGALALDAALALPARVAGLVLLSPGVSGTPRRRTSTRPRSRSTPAWRPRPARRRCGWRRGCGSTGRRSRRAGSGARRASSRST